MSDVTDDPHHNSKPRSAGGGAQLGADLHGRLCSDDFDLAHRRGVAVHAVVFFDRAQDMHQLRLGAQSAAVEQGYPALEVVCFGRRRALIRDALIVGYAPGGVKRPSAERAEAAAAGVWVMAA